MPGTQRAGVGSARCRTAADHVAVLALRLRIVVAGPLAQLGEVLQAQLFHQRGRLAVGVLGVVVRVEAQFAKGEGRQQAVQDR